MPPNGMNCRVWSSGRRASVTVRHGECRVGVRCSPSPVVLLERSDARRDGNVAPGSCVILALSPPPPLVRPPASSVNHELT